MGKEAFGQIELARRQRQHGRLVERRIGEGRGAPVGEGFIPRKVRVGGQTGAFGGKEAIKAGLVIGALRIGDGGGFGIACRFERASQPVTGNPVRNFARL